MTVKTADKIEEALRKKIGRPDGEKNLPGIYPGEDFCGKYCWLYL